LCKRRQRRQFRSVNKCLFAHDSRISADVMCSTASILNLCAISADRYLHIRNPLRYPQLATHRRVLVAIAIVWCLSALISFLPVHLGWHRLDHVTTRGAGLTRDVIGGGGGNVTSSSSSDLLAITQSVAIVGNSGTVTSQVDHDNNREVSYSIFISLL